MDVRGLLTEGFGRITERARALVATYTESSVAS
jgi:hypothetical protein